MFTLDEVVPWGRSFDEYRRMFALSDRELDLKIVGCGDGPANFNAEATRRGAKVVSCDPIYRWGRVQIGKRIASTYDEILDQTRRNADEFIWNSIRSAEELGQIRMAAMQDFLNDYDSGKTEGRYVDAGLPELPFADASFDLALCSHFLFLYSTQLGEAFHRDAILETCRVATEARIFPLLALGGQRSPYVDQYVGDLRQTGFAVTVENVPYEFQRGGNQMMRVRRAERRMANQEGLRRPERSFQSSQVLRSEAVEDLFDGISQPSHQRVDAGVGVLLTFAGQIQIHHGGFQQRMAEVLLDHPEVDPGF